ncbi:MAG: 3-deoxy-manno-octulosonate cytidylyltransferase [Spirochaetes bacterium]|nr:MAG: 3-deoxy-manno-octulosonate cytidylyltransferase [Spirochaetota bacterium]
MKSVGIIPARYASTRLPGKPLKDICGKPMIQHVYERALDAKLLDEVIVATDDQRIIDAVNAFGGKAVLTSADHPNGSSRAAEVVADLDFDLIINIQGDEPLIKPEMIDELAQVMTADNNLDSATLCYQIHEENFADENVVKVVRDRNDFAMYFSRSLIPYPRNAEYQKVYEHIGIYAYRKQFLMKYNNLETTPLSDTESLEQLKVLEHGYRMKVPETRYNYEALSIDTQEDLEKARKIIGG